ncbi:MAG: GGDEF domain-containing protein [Colwellia sp.]
MMFFRQVICSVLIMLLMYSASGFTNEAANAMAPENIISIVNERSYTPIITMLPINADLLSLITLLKQSNIKSKEIEIALVQLTLSKMPLNAAEQYLLLVVQALVKEKRHKENSVENSKTNVIALLEQAAKLSVQISDQQLAQPNFLQLHLILAKHYVKQGEYNLAYIEKESYLKKYHLYRKSKRLAMISSLEKSFEVENKKANNALLKSQNDIKIRRVAEVKGQKEVKQYNFTLIISIAIVFVLLFFRQLKIRHKLIHLALTDPLTNLATRSALFEYGKKMVGYFGDKQEGLSVLLLNLDHFKRINRNFGYNVGDEVLKIVAKLIKETMRSRDVFSRLGGEEFVALLPDTDSHKAKAIAMHINEKISQYDFSLVMHQSKVTISIGIATMKDKQMNFDDLLHRADLAMYQAKEQGRNTVVCYHNISVVQERRVNSN